MEGERMKSQATRQFLACARTLYAFSSTEEHGLLGASEAITAWHRDFQKDLHESTRGYPGKAGARPSPELEDRLVRIFDRAGLKTRKRENFAPTLCLSHDIDYLAPTFQMRAKRLVGYRKWLRWEPGQHYLESVRAMLECERQITGQRGISTVFVASPERSSHWKSRCTQWVIDPSYRVDSPLFESLLKLLREYECEIGVHGSFFSLKEGLLTEEKRRLEKRLSTKITVGRQHWLELPDEKAFDQIAASGLQADSSLGWNGTAGFRSGMARPFPLCLENGAQLWEMPLVLMDGPLFDDLKMSTDAVVAKAQELLEQVFERQGCVSINWHDRAADADYGWFEAYEKILQWAKARGFAFSRISDAIALRKEPAGA